MGTKYYLWSATLQGWATHSGNYGSDLKEAKMFERHDALARCILHYRKGEATFGLVPVRTEDVEEVMQ